MRLTVAGCSPAWPNPCGAHSGYLVEHEGGSVLLDCGPGVLARLRTETTWPEVDAVVITHFHLDHWGDLVPWVWAAMHRGLGNDPARPELWLPPGGTDHLRQVGEVIGFPDMFELGFVLREYRPGSEFTAGGCRITAAVVPHYRMVAHALRLTDGRRTLAYSGDSGPAESLVETAAGADLFVCEATLASPELDGDLRGHLSLDEAHAAFAASGASALLVTHRPSELETPDEFEVAHDGLVRDV